MSEILIVGIMLAAIALIVILLNYSQKKGVRRKRNGFNEYLLKIVNDPNSALESPVQLHHQMVVLDNTGKQVIVIQNDEGRYSHAVYTKSNVKTITSKTVTQMNTNESGKPEPVVLESGIAITTNDAQLPGTFLVVYNHVLDNIFGRADREAAAKALLKRTRELLNN